MTAWSLKQNSPSSSPLDGYTLRSPESPIGASRFREVIFGNRTQHGAEDLGSLLPIGNV